MNLPISGIPYSDTGIQAAGRDFLPVKCNRIDLTKMSGERAQAFALRDAPYLSRCVVGTRHNNIAVNFETPYTCLVSNKDMLAETLFKVPYPECCVARA
jgi:hypothetical protein